MVDCNSSQYKQKYEPFERHAQRYDDWFDGDKGRRIFPIEAACLQGLLKGVRHPWLEVGVGTGRFAAALGIESGIDPSASALQFAAGRGISVARGFAEALPCRDRSYGAVLMIVTVCFLLDPLKAFRECARVLKPDGALLVGLVPRESAWGRLYARKGREGNPFYGPATFYTCEEVIALAARQGLALTRAQSCLFEPPDVPLENLRVPESGIIDGASFVGMRFAH